MHQSSRWRTALLSFVVIVTAVLHASAPADPLRLTHEVVPVAQSVQLTLDPAKEDFSGRTLIDLLANKPFTSFRLHAGGPAFTTVTLTSADGEVTPLTAVISDAQHDLMTLAAPAQLPAGNYRLRIAFTAPYRKDGLGLYKTVSRGDPYLFTQFEEIAARNCFPCWDEPEFKINWQLTITLPASLEVVSNTSPAAETREGDWKTITFGRTPPMPSYLVALAVGPLEFVPVPGLSVPGRIVTPRGQAALGSEAARMAPALLTRLEQYFGIPYPYGKLDQIGAPEFVYGAMENTGLITYNDRLLLIDPDQPSFSARRRLANIMAHEISHMWFGNLVTMKWWDDIWLNESFADWICAKIVEQEYPEFHIMIQQSKAIHGAMRSDALPSISAVRRNVTGGSDFAQLFDELSYSKGKGILNMVESWIGPENFRTAMYTYFLHHQWSNTTSNDLWAVFSEISGEDIARMMAEYVNQPGVPLVAISLETDGRLRLTQSRFHNLGDPQLPGQWQVPVVLIWGKDGQVHRDRILLQKTTQLVDLPGLAAADWIYPNGGEAGYYRWSLSPELNARLARQVAVLKPIERVGLLANTAALFNAGLIDGSDYLAYISAFGRDLDPDVNRSVIDLVGGLRDTFITPVSKPTYHAYRSAILCPLLDRIGLQPVNGEPAVNGTVRNSLFDSLGHEVADPMVVAECRRLADLFLQNPNLVDPAVRNTVVGVAAYHGDATFLTTLLITLAQAKTPIVRSAVIYALGKFHDPVLAGQALAYSLTPALNSTEFLDVVTGVSEDPDLRELAVDWLIAHYDAIAAKAPPEYLARLINRAANGEAGLFYRLRDFLQTPERRSEFGDVSINKTAGGVSLRMNLRAKEQANVLKFLETYAGTTP